MGPTVVCSVRRSRERRPYRTTSGRSHEQGQHLMMTSSAKLLLQSRCTGCHSQSMGRQMKRVSADTRVRSEFVAASPAGPVPVAHTKKNRSGPFHRILGRTHGGVPDACDCPGNGRDRRVTNGVNHLVVRVSVVPPRSQARCVQCHQAAHVGTAHKLIEQTGGAARPHRR